MYLVIISKMPVSEKKKIKISIYTRPYHIEYIGYSGGEGEGGRECSGPMVIVWFQKISIPAPRKVIGNSKRERV